MLDLGFLNTLLAADAALLLVTSLLVLRAMLQLLIASVAIDCYLAININKRFEKNCNNETGSHMSNFFDAEGFYAALDAIRRDREFSWKKVAEKSRVSASTLTRMGQGKRPDVDSLAALASWSGLDVSQFYRDKTERRVQKDTLAEITTLLRADRQIEGEDAQTMELMIKTLYEDMRKRRVNGI